MLPLLPFLLACRPTVGTPVDSDPPDVVDTAPDEIPGTDTGLVPVDVPGETGAEGPEPLCLLTLDCDQPVVNEPKVQCRFSVASGQGRVYYDGFAGVELRGRSSLSFPKPQYAIELWAETGDHFPTDLFGMGTESDWIANGQYVDRALFRNSLTYDTFQSLGGTERFAPESRLCELTLNGMWQGVYMLAESIKRDDERVDVAEDDGTGTSFIVKSDDGGGGFLPATAVYGEWFLDSPSQDAASDAQIAGVSAYLGAWQDAVLGPDPGNPETGMFVYMDEDSAVDFVIIEELTKNADAYALSIHLWKDAGGKLFYAPWDFDLAYGAYPYYTCDETGWVGRTPMITAMASIPEFKTRLEARWTELRSGLLSDDVLLDRISAFRATLGDTAYVNFDDDHWDIDQIQFCFSDTCWLCPIESYDEEYERFRTWLVARTAWIDANIGTF